MMLKLIINDLIILLFNNIPDNITSNKNGNQSNFEKKKKKCMEWIDIIKFPGSQFFYSKVVFKKQMVSSNKIRPPLHLLTSNGTNRKNFDEENKLKKKIIEPLVERSNDTFWEE